MTKKEFISALSESSGVSKVNVKRVLDAMPGVFMDTYEAGEDIVIPGLFKVYTKEGSYHDPKSFTVKRYKKLAIKLSKVFNR